MAQLGIKERLEALLFWKAEPQTIKQLVKSLTASEDEIRSGLAKLETDLVPRGLRLIAKNDEFTLGTAPELGEFFERLAKEELSADLGRAGLETLTIVLYRSPVAKSEIDYLRGVNASFTLRHLLTRGLIEKIPAGDDSRNVFYQPTFELMSLLGLVRLNEMPEFEKIKNQIANFLTADGSSTNK